MDYSKLKYVLFAALSLGLTACGGSDIGGGSNIGGGTTIPNVDDAVTNGISFPGGTLKPGAPPAPTNNPGDVTLTTPNEPANINPGQNSGLEITLNDVPPGQLFDVNVRFGSSNSYISIPIDDRSGIIGGGGTLNLPFSLPANLCDDIPDIQHQIDCFESVDVGSGLQVSRETARQLLLDCRNGGGGNSDQDDLVGASGEVRVNLTWNNTADLDLAVLDPCGNTISFGTQSATCQGFTGTLDVDANAGVVTTSPAENIVWPNGAAPGNYTVTVSYFLLQDVGTTSFSGQSFFAGTSNSFSGSLAVGESQQVDSFTHQ